MIDADCSARPCDAGLEDAVSVLRKVFGYDSFRLLQSDIIESVLAGNDALVVMPTGGGKSVCYQIPALLLPGLTVVVSPLISLMKDQVDQLRQLGVQAVMLNSSLAAPDYQRTVDNIAAGKVRLLYCAPETLMKPEVLSLLERRGVSCLAIDEAHCISEWGHDFRPEYRMLAEVRRRFAQAVCVALTATATTRVRQDICRSLAMKESQVFVAGFNRPNLFYRVVPRANPEQQLAGFLEAHRDESGIIYAFSRDGVETLARTLRSRGHSVLPYHAGLDDQTRRRNQELFQNDDVRIIVATVAFGMGIHKTNVRFVVHHDLPRSIEAYYQETGRAGRDGLDSECLLLYSAGDARKIRYFIDQKSDGHEKRIAVQQLNEMIQYAESRCCRRIPLIRYFGEDYNEEYCGQCDNCLEPAVCDHDVTSSARLFLECVNATGQRFGAAHIIDILRGSSSKRVLEFRHNLLAQHGQGRMHNAAEWKHLAGQFMHDGIVQRNADGYGELVITGAGQQVLAGQRTVMVTRHVAEQAVPRSRTTEIANRDLFDSLRQWRRQTAEEEGVPPYIIFSDKTLQSIAGLKPSSLNGLMSIPGIGSVKLQRYGRAVLKVIGAAIEEESAVPPKRSVSKPGEHTAKIPAHLDSVQLFNTGHNIGQIAKARNVKPQTVLAHLTRAVQEGIPVDRDALEHLLPSDPEIRQKIITAFERFGTNRLAPVYDTLGGCVDYDTLHAVRVYVLARASLC